MSSYPTSPSPDPVPQQQPSSPKRRRRGLWIALIIVVLLVAAVAGGTYYYFQVRSTPLKTLQALCDAIKAPDPQAYYNTLSTKLQAQTSVSALQRGLLLQGGVQDCTVDNNSIQQSGSSATGNINVKYGIAGRTILGIIQLVDENGQWKVDGDTFHLLPIT